MISNQPLGISWSDPDRIQTCNLLIRSQMLYSVEPRGLSLNCDAKAQFFFNRQIFSFLFSIKRRFYSKWGHCCMCMLEICTSNMLIIKHSKQ